MLDASDILKDPTATLEQASTALAGDLPVTALEAFKALHLHILAGGALPAQWRGDGTAIGELVADAHSNARILAKYGEGPGDMATMTRRAISAVTGEG